MVQIQTARTALRAATRDNHDRVDALFSTADLGDRRSYRDFLLAQSAAQLAVETALEAAGVERALPDWPRRRRAALLLADLADLSTPSPAAIEPPAFESEAAVLGAVYVLEGSRLGGQVLKRSVGNGLPTRFLGASDSAGWRRLLAILDERLSNPEKIAAGIEAARKVFCLFEQSGYHYLRANCIEQDTHGRSDQLRP